MITMTPAAFRRATDQAFDHARVGGRVVLVDATGRELGAISIPTRPIACPLCDSFDCEACEVER